jgi:hypothetical protein
MSHLYKFIHRKRLGRGSGLPAGNGQRDRERLWKKSSTKGNTTGPAEALIFPGSARVAGIFVKLQKPRRLTTLMSHYSTVQPNSTTEPVSPEGSDAGLRLGAMKVAEASAVDAGSGLAFPGEDQGQSLVEIAQRDLDAALQLLAERAQYITGASGAAIALRREGEPDMLCRASAGPNAPEMGALLSAEFGLSGESVRTQQPLRCDDAESDGRVNRESCRDLGIASVAVVPVLSDGEVLGVFELFSGQANAFGDRDVAALQRLAEMVETAARFARATQDFPDPAGGTDQQPLESAGEPAIAVASGAIVLTESVTESATESATESVTASESHAGLQSPSDEGDLASQLEASPSSEAELPEIPLADAVGTQQEELQEFKPLLWSASDVSQQEDSGDEVSLPDDGSVPLALKNLRKCEVCGFPISEGRRLCLDCDDKDWRAHMRAAGRDSAKPVQQKASAASAEEMPAEETPTREMLPHDMLPQEIPQAEAPGEISAEDAPVLNVAAEASPSWMASNKYIVGAIVAAALAIGAVVFLR